MQYQYFNVPELLKHYPNWVVCGIQHAPSKALFNPASLLSDRPQPAKAGNLETWCRYQDTVECVRRGLAQGIGYEFGGSAMYGIDLDNVIDDAGAIAPEAREIVNSLNSYTEVSPSGAGLHIFVQAIGADINRHRKKDGFVEIYNEGRYFTVTGWIYGGEKPIQVRSVELQAIHDKFLLPDAVHKESDLAPSAIISDAEQERFLGIGLLRDKVFRALWSGERRHGNESADDQALMNKLAYWCNTDPDAMIRAFMSSPYYHQKDQTHMKKCQRPDYLPITAQKACATVYSTAKADSDRWQQNRTRQRSVAR